MRSYRVLQVGLGMALMAGAISVATAADMLSSDKDFGSTRRPWMVPIPKGEFTMGSIHHSDEAKHQVLLDAYRIDKFEASNARFKEFMKASGHPAPAYWGDPRLSKANQPVVGVVGLTRAPSARGKASGFRRNQNGSERLQFLKATTIIYHWGHTLDPKKANYGQNIGPTTPVDAYPEGVSGFGVYNMAGNVFEWVEDWYDLKYSPDLNPRGADKAYEFSNQGPNFVYVRD